MIRRHTLPTRGDDRSWCWLIVGLQLGGWGAGMLIDALTPLDFAAAFYRQATWPFSVLPMPVLGGWLLTGAAAVAVSGSRWGSEAVAFRLRVYALIVLFVVGLWYGEAGFVYGVMQVGVVLGVTLSGWYWQPRGMR
jgi:hypothetical protein